MSIPWLLLSTLLARDLCIISGASVILKADGEAVDFKAEDKPLRAEPEVRVVMPSNGWDGQAQGRSLMALEEHNKTHEVSVVSSWILFHVPGNQTDSLKQPTLPRLVGGLRDAVADTLEICRSSVGIVDMRAINIDVSNKYDMEYYSLLQDDKKDSPKKKENEGTTLLEHAATLMRSMRAEEKWPSHMNVTQIKAVYEVRTFKEMRVSDVEVGRKIDRFQLYSKFSDLNRLLGRSLAQVGGNGMDSPTLDDVGYSTRHRQMRAPLSHDELKDCVEEVSLHDARQIHQFVMAMALIIVALITCAGSTVFTIKHASSAPSRMNPLVNDDY